MNTKYIIIIHNMIIYKYKLFIINTYTHTKHIPIIENKTSANTTYIMIIIVIKHTRTNYIHNTYILIIYNTNQHIHTQHILTNTYQQQ